MIKSLSILGLRGFATKQTLEFAIPNGKPGSGLTMLVGSNNAGKSTAIEALQALASNQDLSVTRGKRNEKAGDLVEISVTSTDGDVHTLKSVKAGTSEMVRSAPFPAWAKLFPVPSRRAFNPYFNKSQMDREGYASHHGLPATRTTSKDNFSYRLFGAQQKREEFDKVLGRLMDPVPDWVIDQEDTGQHFVKLRTGGVTHSTEGAGEGLVSLLFLADAFYEIADGQLVAIDEPELSLYPAVQRSLAKMLVEYAATHQILVATHSPYFINVESLSQGGRLVRVIRTSEGSELAALTPETGRRLYSASLDANNPHMMGLDAREVFFLEDRITIVEGQEDVMFSGRALLSMNAALKGTIFGWGAGGADKIELIAQTLHELKFKKVVALLDADKANLLEGLRIRFPHYFFDAIPANDIRTKPAVNARPAKTGLLDNANRQVRPEHRAAFSALLEKANTYFSG
jgi:predicted ATPase